MRNKNEQSLFYILNCLQNVQESPELKSWLFYWKAYPFKSKTHHRVIYSTKRFRVFFLTQHHRLFPQTKLQKHIFILLQ